jgi:hypothetical protein
MAGLPDLDQDAIEWLTMRILEAVIEAERVEPMALLYLLRRYAATDRGDLRDALGHSLASALTRAAAGPADDRARWLTLFTETAAISDDERLPAAAGRLVSSLREEWSAAREVDRAACSIEACLQAADVLAPRDLVPAAIDELERIVGATYRPGQGVGHLVDQPNGQRGRLSDQVRAASALLAGYAQCGRLPYSMLAEELMRFARRTLWDEQDGGFFGGLTPGEDGKAGRAKPFALNCEAARVLCRLDVLHRDAGQREGGVMSDACDYADDAARTLLSQTPDLRARDLEAAVYGIALGEWLTLRS